MRVTTFCLDKPYTLTPKNPITENPRTVFHIPLLGAYATIHTTLTVNTQIMAELSPTSVNYSIVDEFVFIKDLSSFILSNHLTGVLTVYHSGIKDFSLLFPQVEDLELRERLGQFSEEAEAAFESKSWMSYVLMVGAVVEGLLYSQFGKDNFNKLIKKAGSEGILEKEEVKVFNEVRQLRNRVHASKYQEPFANRRIAMDLSVIYDRLLKRRWREPAASVFDNLKLDEEF